MKKIMITMVTVAFSLGIYSEIQNTDDSRKVSELTVDAVSYTHLTLPTILLV